MAVLYHYTELNALGLILRSDKLLASRKAGPRDDAVYGDGVYATSLSPLDHPWAAIGENNWGGPVSLERMQIVLSFKGAGLFVNRGGKGVPPRDVWVSTRDCDLEELSERLVAIYVLSPYDASIVAEIVGLLKKYNIVALCKDVRIVFLRQTPGGGAVHTDTTLGALAGRELARTGALQVALAG